MRYPRVLLLHVKTQVALDVEIENSYTTFVSPLAPKLTSHGTLFCLNTVAQLYRSSSKTFSVAKVEQYTLRQCHVVELFLMQYSSSTRLALAGTHAPRCGRWESHTSVYDYEWLLPADTRDLVIISPL
jgi:hypothetical protein